MATVRKATAGDIVAVVAIYDRIITNEENGKSTVGWKRDIYPTKKTAELALAEDELFVMETDNVVVAAAIINQKQVAEYKNVSWQYLVEDNAVMVLHTLVVDPLQGGHGYGTAFVKFYEEYACEHNCRYLRMDTNEKNVNARRLYAKLGYTERGIIPCNFNGLENVQLVCLEKTLK